MKSCTVLYLLSEAIEIANRMAKMKFVDMASTESHRHDVTYLMGYLRALEAVVKHEEPPLKLHDDDNEDLHDHEVEKLTRRLKFWSRKPDQINSLILASYLRLVHDENKWPVPVTALRHRYVQERCRKIRINLHQADKEFVTNFGPMKTIAIANHGKVFEVDENNHVSIWAKAAAPVESFRKEMLIGE